MERIDMNKVLERLAPHIPGVDSRMVRRLVAMGKFPAPIISLTQKTSFWKVADVDEFIESLTA